MASRDGTSVAGCRLTKHMKWSKLRDAILSAFGFKKDTANKPSTVLSPDVDATGRSAPAWNRTVHASCWNGNNAKERMMNVLSPKMDNATFRKRLAFMTGRGCDTAHVFLVNQGDGEAAGYSPWGTGKAPSSAACDTATVAHMKSRIEALRGTGLAVVVWIVADDSSAWANALFQNAAGAMSAISKAGLLDEASYVVLGLEMDEYGEKAQWTTLRDALRKAGYAGKIGVHHTGGKATFASLGDIVLDQLDPKEATVSAIAKSVKALKAMGKAVVGFEYARGPDRDKANAALKAGAFAVGNW